MRINRYIASCGVSSRRGADELIDAGRICLNGKVATRGENVEEGDTVTLDGEIIRPEEGRIILACNKPAGVVCSAVSQGRDEINIIDMLGYPKRLFNVGRLDKDSEGLVLLTNDGKLADEIMRAGNFHEKEYEVEIGEVVTKDFVEAMSRGVTISFEDNSSYVTRECKVRCTGDRTFNIVLTEGKNRQIRRMCEALGCRVLKLKRIRVINVMLGDLRPGEYRDISDDFSLAALHDAEERGTV